MIKGFGVWPHSFLRFKHSSEEFLGDMIHKAGAGPKPIPHKKLTVANLRDAIKYAIGPEAKAAAKKMSQDILNENGVQNGAQSFYQHLPLLNMRCDLDPSRLAVWWSTHQVGVHLDIVFL